VIEHALSVGRWKSELSGVGEGCEAGEVCPDVLWLAGVLIFPVAALIADMAGEDLPRVLSGCC